MNNYFKIYLLFLIPSYFALGFGFYNNYSSQQKRTNKDFKNHYAIQVQNHAEQIKKIEEFYEGSMKNALWGIERELLNKDFSNDNLRSLVSKYNVSHLFLIDKKGRFTHSTNELPSKIPNLFGFSREYENLIGTKEKYLTTPIILPFPEKEPHKFLTTWSNGYFIEIGVRITDIAKSISELYENEKNILKANIRIGNRDYSVQGSRENTTGRTYTATKSIIVSNKNYAQSQKPNTHQYELNYVVSRDELTKDLTQLQSKHIRNFILTIILITLLLLIATYLLRSSVERVTKSIVILSKNEEFNKDIAQVSSSDDINSLTSAINSLLSGYRKNKKEVIDKISSQVAHDIRSPLIALQNYFKQGDNNKEVAIKALTRIENIASRLGNKRFNSKKQIFSPLAAINDLIEEYAIYSKNEIKLVADEISKNIQINANITEFKAAISNIINNSLESIKNPVVIISLIAKEKEIEISISDNGPGIKNPDSVFTEGFTTKSEGSGLGLYQVKNFVSTLPGDISINSTNNGTTIILELPIHPKRPIIILDDDDLYLKTSEMRLNKMGHEFHMFKKKNDLYSFLEKNSEKEFDLYLDINIESQNDGLIVKSKLQGLSNLNILLNSSSSSEGKEFWV